MSRSISILILAFVLMSGCIEDNIPNVKMDSARDLVNSLERYSVAVDRPNVDFEAVSATYINGVNEGMTDEEFFEHTRDFLLNFRSPHIWLLTPFEQMFSIQNLYHQRNINLELVRTQYLTDLEEHTSRILSGTINGNIGYVYIEDFEGDNADIEPVFHNIIDDFSDKSGLIIDVRDNDGGSAYNVRSLLNKLSANRVLWHTTQNKIEGGFDAPFNWYITPEGNFQFTGPVIVLTGNYTISAGERFAMGAKALPNVTIVGDTTSNTQGSVMGREMLNGWKYTFTFERCFGADGTNYEGVGIDPDIYVDTDGLDLENGDAVLERAIQELL